MIVIPSRDDDYPGHVGACVACELNRLRLKRDFAIRELAIPGLLSRSAISNIENLRHSPRLATVALYCQQLGTTFEWLLPAALRRWGGRG